MKGKSASIILVLIWLLVGTSWGDLEASKPHFEGLKEVSVFVEDPDPIAEKHGLTRSMLQTDAELKLRLAGIKVVDLHSNKSVDAAYLYIEIAATGIPKDGKEIGVALTSLLNSGKTPT